MGLDDHMEAVTDDLRIVVIGTPAPQGSKRHALISITAIIDTEATE